MKSMTGYGSSQFKDRRLELEVHVKSVNGRFLEVRFHLPKEYAPFENDLRKTFRSWTRGTVDVYVHRRLGGGFALAPATRVSKAIARHWARELKTLARELDVPYDVKLTDLLQMPQVLESAERPGLLEGELERLNVHLAKACAACDKLRLSEGRALKKELLRQLQALDELTTVMESWRPEALKHAEQRLKTRLASLETEGLDPARLSSEARLGVDRMDVREELIRLREHVRACLALVRSKEARGKKLDFYCQELLREINTIGSKSQLASLTETVVDAKSVVEKFREQVQNIE